MSFLGYGYILWSVFSLLLGVALEWPWCGLGVALVWPWSGLGVALVWPWCGLVLGTLLF